MDNDIVFSLDESIIGVNTIDPMWYDRYDVKRGLRNADGSGVVAGITNISNVHGYVMSDGDKIADEGRLTLRGYDIRDLIGTEGAERRYNFEEVAYLLLMGKLPTWDDLMTFMDVIDRYRELPDGFTGSMIMQATPPDIMNMLERSVLMLYGYDERAEEDSYEHEITTAIQLLSRMPRIAVLSHYARSARFYNGSMIMHRFVPGQSAAETFLSMLRPDRSFTPDEARLLDIMLCLHAEHGGGNNSTFTCRVLSSSATDPYSAYAGAIGSLKGKRHGGANHLVRAMHEDMKAQVADWEDEGQVADYLRRIVRGEAFDHSGLIYGMGHAVYTKSDPRAVILKEFAGRLAKGTEHEEELRLLEMVERLSPEIFKEFKGDTKDLCANVDMYSGFVYSMLGIPEDLYTPLFACARFAGWAAHRFEEIAPRGRIIRPAYKSTHKKVRPFTPISER